MKWYWIGLIAYGLYILILWIFFYWKQYPKPLKNILFGLVILILMVILTPIAWIVSLINPYYEMTSNRYKVYEAKPLTDDNKIALINMGFHRLDNYREYYTGIYYSGYRRYGIIVQDNGYISVNYNWFIDDETKNIIKIIRNFPK